jgi:hemerythrin
MATTLAWNEKFSVGVKGIDRQHKEILSRVNALFDAIGSRESGRNVDELLTFMQKYVRTHFLCEEKLMRRYDYAGYDQHLREHERFRAELANVEKMYDRTGLSDAVVARMASYITEWLSAHFIDEDRRLAGFLQERGARLHKTNAAA